MGTSTYQIDVEETCFAVTVDNQTGLVVDAASVAQWMIGKPYHDVKLWVQSKNGKMVFIRATWL